MASGSERPEDMTESCGEDLRSTPKAILEEFLQTYKEHPALWNVKNKTLYNNKHYKTIGYNALLKVWRKFDVSADIKSVKQKIQSLRGSFRKESKKVANAERLGNGVGVSAYDEYYPSLWYYPLLTFLLEEELPTTSVDISSEPEARKIFTFPSPVSRSQTPASEGSDAPPEKFLFEEIKEESIEFEEPIRKRRKTEEEDSRLSAVTCNNVVDESEAFAQLVRRKMESVQNREQRMHAEMLILQVLNKAIMNSLNGGTVVY